MNPKRHAIASLANLALIVVIWAGLTALVAFWFAPRWWVYIVLVPLFFFVAGFFQERLLSGLVNRAVHAVAKKRR